MHVSRIFPPGSILLRLLAAGFLSLALGAAHAAGDSAVPAESGARKVVIGSVWISEPSSSARQIDRAFEALEKAFTSRGMTVEVKILPTDKLGELIEAGEVDLFLASGGLYRSYLSKGARDIATLFDPRSASPNRGIGSVVIVRSDRDDLQLLSDLEGRSIMSSYTNAFTGNAYAMGEIALRGYDPEKFFAERIYRHPAGRVIDAVIAGEVESGVVVACLVDELAAAGDPRAKLVRVLEPRSGDGFSCQHTSELYPSWTFATTPRASSEVSTIATTTLLTLPANAVKGEWRWSVATDFSRTDALLKTLRLGPYRILRGWTLRGFFERYSGAIALGTLAVLLLAFHSSIVGVLVRRRTHELSEALKRERVLFAEKTEATERLETLQRVGAVGQMCSMLAHELKQPLAVMRLSARALLRFLEEPEPDTERISQAALAMQREAGRAAEIVDRVRAYAGRKSDRVETELRDAVALAIGNLEKSGRCPVKIETRIAGEKFPVLADPLELELAIVNLLKNAGDAVKGVKAPRVSLSLVREDGKAVVTVTDNGSRLSDEAFAKLGEPLRTSKTDGMGLGTVIVAKVAEAGGGALTFERASEKGDGVRARFTMLIIEKTEEKDK
ncbi:PhnD/SsuA/transferrin family substrate-binding protein [Sutterella sp.]|uniref:sensor histidine kinase n=1 Tax=Sutterella sp. TaxID=1981025 RepID=UPI0026E0AFA2|nr:PhnD/SsuA/transferrin family substrate-binding protein [Sutterella sp.]MDO5531548.1 PhnD/SsuA/transferrin family substrate-binding protein [Sutterella sp.]